jgi:molybdate transport system substrate-binding protein
MDSYNKSKVVTTLIDKRIFLSVIAALILVVSAGFAEDPKELTVFTAASLTGAFGEIGQARRNETNISVAFNFDDSQSLRIQIENGAYADIFTSANKKQMNAVKADGIMNDSSVIIFTNNKLSLVVPKYNPEKISNLTDLAKPGLRIVVGTKDVPVGDYAMQIINKLGNDSAYGSEYKKNVLANVISQETNVNYVVTKAALGEADVGFAYISDVTENLMSKVHKIEIPDEYNVIAEYLIGILKDSKYSAESEKFIELVTSDKGKTIMEKYGFAPVEGTTAKAAVSIILAKASA